MQPSTVAVQNNQTQVAPATSALRDFYKNITGTPTSQQAEGDVSSFNKLTPNTGSILQEFDQRYGVNDAATRVGELRKSVMNAEDLVNGVDDNVFARTSNALVSDAQRARLTAAEKDPLVKQLGVIGRNFDMASQDLQGAQAQSNRFSGAEIGDIETMRTSLGQRLTTAQTREAEEARKRQEAEANRQWWENFYESKRATDMDMDLRRRQLDAQIAASRQSTNDLMAQIRASQVPAAAPAAVAPTAAPRVQAPSLFSSYNVGQAAKGGYFSDIKQNVSEGFNNVAKYGPLALFGKGTAW